MLPATLPLRARIARIAPFFASSRRGFVIAFFASIVGALTEPVIPLLLRWLLDNGFQLGKVPLWTVPLAVVGLTVVRGLAGSWPSTACRGRPTVASSSCGRRCSRGSSTPSPRSSRAARPAT
jgi:hypothetical protein